MITASPHGPIASYLPHRPPMLLIDDVLEASDERFVCRATIRDDCVFAVDRQVHPSAMIEFAAQTCAAGIGVLAAREGNPPKLGLIMGCREMEFGVDFFGVGDELVISADKAFGQTHIAAFACTVARAGAVCVTIHLSVVELTSRTGEAVVGKADRKPFPDGSSAGGGDP